MYGQAGAGRSGGRPKTLTPNYDGIGRRDALSKKVPENPAYAGIGAKVSTGARWRDDITFTRPKRANEFFGRVKADLLVNIIEENEDEEESLYSLAAQGGGSMGGGSMGNEVVHTAGSMGGHSGHRPYILLDMRPPDQFERFHIRTAVNFPIAYLSRSTNCFTAEVLPYINHPEHIVIIVCDDEKNGCAAASRLTEKNIENAYLLSGGLQHFAVSYSSYVDGDVPDDYASAVPPKGRNLVTGSSRAGTGRAPGKGQSSASRRQSGGGSMRGGDGHYGQGAMGGARHAGGGMRAGGGGGGGRPDTGSSNASRQSAVESVRSQQRR